VNRTGPRGRGADRVQPTATRRAKISRLYTIRTIHNLINADPSRCAARSSIRAGPQLIRLTPTAKATNHFFTVGKPASTDGWGEAMNRVSENKKADSQTDLLIEILAGKSIVSNCTNTPAITPPRKSVKRNYLKPNKIKLDITVNS